MWLSVDPLAEFMPEWSSYNYAFSNPIKFNDPTGMAPEIMEFCPADWVLGKDGDTWVWREDITSKKQANAEGLQYGGKSWKEVINNWGHNTDSDTFEGWWNNNLKNGHGQVFDNISFVKAKVTPKIEKAFWNRRQRSLQEKGKEYENMANSIDFEVINIKETGSWRNTNNNHYSFDTTINLGGQDLKINVFFLPVRGKSQVSNVLFQDNSKFGKADGNYIRLYRHNEMQPIISIQNSSPEVYKAIYNYTYSVDEKK